MKFSTSLIASAVLLATSSVALAAQDYATTVQINVTQGEVFNLTGDAVNSTNGGLADFTIAQMNTADVNVGTLGFAGNVVGTCSIVFASANNYALTHTGAGTQTIPYQVGWNGLTISDNATNTNGVNCVTADTMLTMASITDVSAGTFDAGTYSDVITVTVTTP